MEEIPLIYFRCYKMKVSLSMNNNYTQKKIAIINDLAGYGKCALTISLPIISSMKVACSPFPTSIFSNHTGYPSFHFKDLTDEMIPYI